MRKHSRYVAAALSFLFLTFCSLLLAGNLELILTQRAGRLTPHPLTLLLGLTRRGYLLWAMLDGLGCLGIWWALYGQSYLDYRSKMYEVVPGFEIPMPDGQGQNGTAWWLDKEACDKVFSSLDTRAITLPEPLTNKYERERDKIYGTDD